MPALPPTSTACALNSKAAIAMLETVPTACALIGRSCDGMRSRQLPVPPPFCYALKVGTWVKIGTIQRRLARPLRKDDKVGKLRQNAPGCTLPEAAAGGRVLLTTAIA
eukprot:1143481-Pelagomonas_calceolata.AAC.2